MVFTQTLIDEVLQYLSHVLEGREQHWRFLHLRQLIHFQLLTEGVRRAHGFREGGEDQVAHLYALLGNDITELLMKVA